MEKSEPKEKKRRSLKNATVVDKIESKTDIERFQKSLKHVTSSWEEISKSFQRIQNQNMAKNIIDSNPMNLNPVFMPKGIPEELNKNLESMNKERIKCDEERIEREEQGLKIAEKSQKIAEKSQKIDEKSHKTNKRMFYFVIGWSIFLFLWQAGYINLFWEYLTTLI